MNFTDHIAGLDAFAAELNDLVAAAFERLLVDIRAGVDARTALDSAYRSYVGPFEARFADAMTERLKRLIGVNEIRALKLDGITLSNSLYRNNAAATRAVLTAIKAHLKGWQSVDKLALQIYEGYGFQAARGMPELLPKARINPVPRYLRKAFADDALFRNKYAGLKGPELDALLNDPIIGPRVSLRLARARAMNLRTPALKAAYLQALKDLEKGAGQDRLARSLKTAWEEKQRYHAARISQTELHRAWSDDAARTILADRRLNAVKVQMSATHPRRDICDYHATLNAYGLGPGVYPKAMAPNPPYHPFCRCRLVNRYGIDAKGAKLDLNAGLAYLRTMHANEASQVIGSRAKLQEVLKGADVLGVVNRKVPKKYQTKPLSG